VSVCVCVCVFRLCENTVRLSVYCSLVGADDH